MLALNWAYVGLRNCQNAAGSPGNERTRQLPEEPQGTAVPGTPTSTRSSFVSLSVGWQSKKKKQNTKKNEGRNWFFGKLQTFVSVDRPGRNVQLSGNLSF